MDTPFPALPPDADAQEAQIVCPNCGTEWELTPEELAQSAFTCADCETEILLGAESTESVDAESWWRHFLPRSESKWVFVVVMVAYARFLQHVVDDLVTPFTGDDLYLLNYVGWGRVLGHIGRSVVLTPIWETLLLVTIIELLRLVDAPDFLQVILSSAVLCVVDGFYWWPHGVIVAPFFILSALSYLYWRPLSLRTAVGLLMIIHAASNSIPSAWLICKQMDRDIVSRQQTGYSSSWSQADELYRKSMEDFQNGSYTAAIDQARSATLHYPYDPRYFVQLGTALRKNGQLSMAELGFHKAIDLDETNWEAWIGLAAIFTDEKRYPQLLDALHRASISAPPYALPAIQRSISLASRKLSGTAP